MKKVNGYTPVVRNNDKTVFGKTIIFSASDDIDREIIRQMRQAVDLHIINQGGFGKITAKLSEIGFAIELKHYNCDDVSRVKRKRFRRAGDALLKIPRPEEKQKGFYQLELIVSMM